MNPRLDLLRPYPFERLRELLAGVAPPAGLSPVALSLGEPQHPTPAFLKEALAANLGAIARYPFTLGLPELRRAIAGWLGRRHGVTVDFEKEVIPVLGTREALFAIAQAVLDPSETGARVISPNPFYQIYEGAALLGGAQPYYVNARGAEAPDWDAVPDSVWNRTRLLYACSPANPSGRVMRFEEWKRLFELSDRHGFVIVSDEPYGELYFDEAKPPLGALAAARMLGREGWPRLVVMGSLSKRSNAPGLRSGFAAGDRAILERFVLYRTYHGSQMSNAVQLASVAAWNDEAHVVENRRLYREKFASFYERVNPVLPLTMPEAGFYFWASVSSTGAGAGGDDTGFTRELFRAAHVTVLPGSYIARDTDAGNPGRGYVRMALVSTVEETREAASRIRHFIEQRAPAAAGAARA
ncbi:MAG TPA: succinyldiaminopimelate transaminase [Usitatibacter sp.]|nr:succinyldiaminopimelate transaminase [Usitatibacter sp.]